MIDSNTIFHVFGSTAVAINHVLQLAAPTVNLRSDIQIKLTDTEGMFIFHARQEHGPEPAHSMERSVVFKNKWAFFIVSKEREEEEEIHTFQQITDEIVQ